MNAYSGRLPARLLLSIMIMMRNYFGSNHYECVTSVTHLRHVFVIRHEVPL